MTLDGEVIVVTGASRGLGRSMALRFSREGAAVAATARSRDALESLAGEAPGEVLAEPADVREAADVDRVVERAAEALGPPTVLVNNAAVGLLSLTGDLKGIGEITESEWDRVIETNLKGPFLFTRAVLPHMADRGGNVINVTSAFGKHGKANWAPYVSSKHGLEGLTETAALEFGEHGINVNALGPGTSVETGFWDTEEKRRHLSPEQRERVSDPDVMNDAAVLLAAQGPDGVTGESLTAGEWEERLA